MATGRATALLVGLVAIVSSSCTVENKPTTKSATTSQLTIATTGPPATATTISQMLDLPPRRGEPPSVTDGIPHIQLDQTSSDEMLAELAEWAFSLNGIVEMPSLVSLPGARAMTVVRGSRRSPNSSAPRFRWNTQGHQRQL